MHPITRLARRAAAILAACTLAACVDKAPTSGMSAVQSDPLLAVTPGFPQEIMACSVNWPVVGGPCEAQIGVTASVSPGIYLDSLLTTSGFARELSSVPVRRATYYSQNGIPVPASPPLTITLSRPVRGMIVQVIPWVTHRTAYATVKLTEADGSTNTYQLSRACTFVNTCRIRPTYTSDVGITKVEISVPPGEHFGASLSIGGVVEQPSGVSLTLSAPSGMTMPSERASASDGCAIEPVTRERAYGVLARNIATGMPVANLPVTLTLGAVDGSGGHRLHTGARPAGSFAAASDVATMEVVTDAEGRAQFTWHAPEFAGRAFVTVSAAGAAELADTFTVGVPLARMTPGRWRLAAMSPNHDDASYAAPQMIAAAGALADSVDARWGQQLGFGDMSLPLGGRFDAAGDWVDPQHCSHRWGNALDLRTDELTTAQRNFIALRWRHLTGRAPVIHSGRLHLQTWREL